MTTDAASIRTRILSVLDARQSGKSICPSEVARALSPDWRPLMKAVRAAAVDLVREGRIDILRKGRPVGLDASDQAAADIKGVIRLRRRPETG